MTTVLRVACVQMTSGAEIAPNIESSTDLIRRAHGDGAQFVALPEVVNLCEKRPGCAAEKAHPEATEPALRAYRDLAAELGIWILAGSLLVKLRDDHRFANRSFLIGADGAVVAAYDKIHMFDVDLGDGEVHRESNAYAPGSNAVTADLPWGRLGMTVCYDLRFPAWSRGRNEFDLLIYVANWPAARRSAWRVLLPARAVENQCYVAGVNRIGEDGNGVAYAGDSLVADYLGNLVSDCENRLCSTTVSLDLDALIRYREKFPAFLDGDEFAIRD